MRRPDKQNVCVDIRTKTEAIYDHFLTLQQTPFLRNIKR
jgi:hypothetical protein